MCTIVRCSYLPIPLPYSVCWLQLVHSLRPHRSFCTLSSVFVFTPFYSFCPLEDGLSGEVGLFCQADPKKTAIDYAVSFAHL